MTFVQALENTRQQGLFPVIPDIKCISPKEGDLMRGRSPADIAKRLVCAGAPVLSVVTESKHFGGSLAMLSRIAELTEKPVLRKDFIRRAEQVRESAQAGAKAVLLIVSMLEDPALETLLAAAGENGVDTLVEVHNESEIRRVNALGLGLVGINNRDILALEKDSGTVDATERLIHHIAGRPLIVSESAIRDAADVLRARSAGAHAVLVGTALLQAPDIAAAYRQLSVPLS